MQGAVTHASVTFTCPRCRRTSYNPNDARDRYCGACKWWTGDPTLGQFDPRASDGHDVIVPFPTIEANETLPPGVVEFRDTLTGRLVGRLLRDELGVWHTEVPPAT